MASPPISPSSAGGGVASLPAQIQGLARFKLVSLLVSRVVRELVPVLMTFLMRRRTTLLTTLRITLLMTSVACDAGLVTALRRHL